MAPNAAGIPARRIDGGRWAWCCSCRWWHCRWRSGWRSRRSQGRGWGIAIVVIVGTTGLAQRSLHDHVAAVLRPLSRGDLPAARRAVAMIVGRDTGGLDEAGIATAAIESLAESFCDGVVAPRLLVSPRRPARAVRSQGDQYRRQHDRPPHRPFRGIRLGERTRGRCRELGAGPDRGGADLPGRRRRVANDAARCGTAMPRRMAAGRRRRWRERSAGGWAARSRMTG